MLFLRTNFPNHLQFSIFAKFLYSNFSNTKFSRKIAKFIVIDQVLSVMFFVDHLKRMFLGVGRSKLVSAFPDQVLAVGCAFRVFCVEKVGSVGACRQEWFDAFFDTWKLRYLFVRKIQG
jgi:hypothetical protein